VLDIPLSPAAASPTAAVVLLDARGRPCGTAPKHAVHSDHTPLHLAFSCYVVDDAGRVLLTHRAAAKRTWPSTWTNACCGHPLPGETLRQAVTRHLRDELGVAVGHLAVALPDFAYRATMFDGTVEHELCPVVVATIIGDVTPDPAEADAAEWVEWAVLVARAEHAPATLSPWSVHQIAALHSTIGHPASWLADRPHPPVRTHVVRTAQRPGTSGPDPFGCKLEARLDEVIDARIARLRTLDERAAVIGETVGALIRRSAKRLRPAFVHWGHVAGGGDGRSAEVVDLAAAVELLHTFALVHDDVIDRSPARRGGPSVHVALAAGRDAWFGTSAAIVAGDLAFVWADELLDAACVDRPLVREAWTTLRTEVIAGQYLDMHLSMADACTGADPLRVALLKSGRYTVTRPLELGARLAGADDDTVGRLLAYGDAAGVAFQLRDDVLGVFGDEAVTGKDAFSDLREGKRTLLVARAFELGGRAARQELARHLGDVELTEDGAARCRAIIAESGALASVEARIAAEVMAAASSLHAVAEPARTALAELLGALTDRTC